MPRWSCPHLDHCFSTLECQERKLGRIMKNCRMPRHKHSLSKFTFSILSDYLILFYQDLGEVGSNCSSPVFISARRSLWSTKPPSSWTSKYQSSKTRQTASRLYFWITTNRWTLAKKKGIKRIALREKGRTYQNPDLQCQTPSASISPL